MHFYPFHIGDYAKHTKGLSIIEDIAYRRILDEYYLSERPLNGSSTDVARMIGMRDYVDDVAYVLNRFFAHTDDGWFSRRADAEITKYYEIVEKKSKAGKASAEARKNKRLTGVEHVLNECSTDEVQTKNQEPRTNKKISPPEGVPTDVWQDYVKFRQAKKAPITSTSIKQIETQASKVGFTLTEAIQECLNRGWTGFKGDWVTPKKANSYSPLD